MIQHQEYEDFLAHYGVKGMKWGVRKARRDARRDAKEFARAKMFYGEGAGNRRKLIKATVESRSKDPHYKKYFDEELARRDGAADAAHARKERKRKDRSNSVKKNARGVVNIARGNIAYAPAALAGAYGVAKFTGADKAVASQIRKHAPTAKKHAKRAAHKVKSTYRSAKSEAWARDQIRKIRRNLK